MTRMSPHHRARTRLKITSTRRTVPLLACLGVALLAPATLEARDTDGRAEAIDLTPRLEEGAEWRFRYHVKSEMDFELMNQTHEMDLTKETVVRARVVRSDDDGAEVELTHEEIRLNATGEVPGSFDSEKPPAKDSGTYATLLRPLVEARLTLVMNTRGEIERVEGLDRIQPDGMMEAMLFKSLFGQDEIIRMYGPLFSLRPDTGQAKLGESWTIRRRQASGLGVMEDTVRLTLADASKHDAHFTVKGEQELEGVVASSSEIEGTAIWDLDKGVLRQLKTTSITRFAPEKDKTAGVSIKGEARATTRLDLLDSSGR